MTLADFTSPNLVIPRLRGHDVATVLQELSQVLQREKRITDLLPFYHAALNREFMVSTDMDTGMALPHVHLPTLTNLAFALGRSDRPLTWAARSTTAVRLVFLSAVPATDSTQYLAVVSGLARLAKHDHGRLLEKLKAAHNNCQMIDVLKQIELRCTAIARDQQKTTC